MAVEVSRKPSRWMAWFVVSATAIFAAAYGRYVVQALRTTPLDALAVGVVVLKTSFEIAASCYLFSFLFASLSYLSSREKERKPVRIERWPPVAVVYLCCEDLDLEALASLAELRYRGPLRLIIHDDARSAPARAAVDAAVSMLRSKGAVDVLLLRRPDRTGGKPAALNYVLAHTAHLYDYFLLCDSDSVALDPLVVEKAMPYFGDPRVAIVQSRSQAVIGSDICRVNRLLSRSIDAFHVFLDTEARFGWTPFMGHNAVLRTGAVLEAGGFTPGYFSDDLDLTVRLNLRGLSVAYAPEIHMAEKHPPSYDALRRRSYKWAYGCVQVLKAHSWAVLKSRRLSFPQKLAFFQFSGFYMGQTALLAYLALVFLIGPFLLQGYPYNVTAGVVAGALVVAIIYLPFLSFYLNRRQAIRHFFSVVLCGLTYGASDFACARGAWDCLRTKQRDWTPSNALAERGPSLALTGEFTFGLMLFAVPLLVFPMPLLLPSSYFFIGKFLFGPSMSLFYDDRRRASSPSRRSLKTVGVTSVLVLLLLGALAATPAIASPSTGSVQVRGKSLYLNGHPFLVKGIHYGPWRPGTGPAKHYPYPRPALIRPDLRLIRQANANTIAVFDPPGYVLDLAQAEHLKVLYVFFVDWWKVGTKQGRAEERSMLERVKKYRDKPALLGWVLGNEIPVVALQKRGTRVFEKSLHALYRSVKAIDHTHLVTSASWPLAKQVDLSFFDVISFNVYPLWPPEVQNLGYGKYIKTVLQPLAGDKPLLITEFGADTVEAGNQGEVKLLKSSWQGLIDAKAAGGVTFEFADEWWKNYDNPRNPGDWWNRKPAPNDEKRYDLDPEEHYGLMTAFRKPRPAFYAVKRMFATTAGQRASGVGVLVPGALVGTVVLIALAAWVSARWTGRVRAPESS